MGGRENVSTLTQRARFVPSACWQWQNGGWGGADYVGNKRTHLHDAASPHKSLPVANVCVSCGGRSSVLYVAPLSLSVQQWAVSWCKGAVGSVPVSLALSALIPIIAIISL